MGDVHIERIGMQHYEECMALSQFAFQYKRTEAELEEGRAQFLAEHECRWGAFVNGQLAAQMTILELQCLINGDKFAIGGVAGVATWPEQRRQGLVTKLLAHALKEMKEQGLSISVLHPFDYGFYRKFGWEAYADIKIYTLELNQLPKRTPYSGHIERINAQFDTLNLIYDKYAVQYNGMLIRTEKWWQYRVSKRKQGEKALYYDKNGIPQGYLIYAIQNREMKVHELVTLNEEARVALWSFIAQHDSMMDRVSLVAPSDDILPYLLPNPRIKHEVQPSAMARIVDVVSFIEQYSFLEGSEEEIIQLQLTDEHAPWNADRFILRIDLGGNGTLLRSSDSKSVEQSKEIILDIGSLTVLLLGYRGTKQLSQYKRIQGDLDTMNRLHRRIPEQTTYLSDFF